jgi:hypothetical protein
MGVAGSKPCNWYRSQDPARVGTLARLAEYFGRDQHLFARDLEVLQGLAGDLLGQAVRIDIRGIDEIDAGVDRLPDQAFSVALLQVADLAPHAF